MRWIQIVSFALVLYLTAAYNTRFIFDEEPKKPNNIDDNLTIEDPKILKELLENNIDDNLTVEDQTLEIKNIFSTIGNRFINNLKSISKPNGGNSAINKLNSTMKEINKTAQVIRLTAEYINISANYVLSTINQYMNGINDANELAANINNINNKLFTTLIDHVNSTVNEIVNKAKTQTITGEDLLFSISYHLVTAFQDITNTVLTLTSKKTDTTAGSEPTILVKDPWTPEPKPAVADKETQTENKPVKQVAFLDTVEVFSPTEIKSNERKIEVINKETQTGPELKHNNILDTVEVFSPLEIKSLNNKNIPVFLLTAWEDCNSEIKPVCAVDLSIKKYIIFLNDCRRKAHNRMHGANYSVYNMDVCTGLFLRNPGFGAHVIPQNPQPVGQNS